MSEHLAYLNELGVNLRDGIITVGQDICIDGCHQDCAIRIQSNLKRSPNDLDSSQRKQDKIIVSHPTFDLLNFDGRFNRRVNNEYQFVRLKNIGGKYIHKGYEISFMNSRYMIGSVMPIIKIPTGKTILYASDFLGSPSNLIDFDINIIILDSDYYDPNFDWNYAREDSAKVFLEVFNEKWRANNRVAVTGSSGHIEEVIALLSRNVRCPMLLDRKLFERVHIYCQYLGFTADVRLYNYKNRKDLEDRREKYAAFFDIEDVENRDYLDFDSNLRILIENEILPSSNILQRFSDGKVRVIWPNRADFKEKINLVKHVKPDMVLTTSTIRGGNSFIMAEYIENELRIKSIADLALEGYKSQQQFTISNISSSIRERAVKRLILYVPCEIHSKKDWEPLIEQLKRIHHDEFSNTTWVPCNNNHTTFKDEHPLSLSKYLKAKIDESWEADGPYEKVVIIGHGLGGLLVRQAYLLASGMLPDHPETPWFSAVDRLILLSVPSRGISPWKFPISHLFFSITEKITSIDLRFSDTTTNYFEGSKFIANLRIDWIRHFSKPAYPLKVVHILSTTDKENVRDSSIDEDAYFIDIPDSNPYAIIKCDQEVDGATKRIEIIKSAIVSEELPKAQKNKTFARKDEIIFILHGM
jgi:hypothetical protein